MTGTVLTPGRAEVSVALIHWPVLDRSGAEVVTNVTNFDIHDIARASRTYGVKNYFIVNRLPEQLMFVSRVLDHWRIGQGSVLNPMRRTALGMVQPVATFEDLLKAFPEPPLIVATAARDLKRTPPILFRDLRARIFGGSSPPLLLLFGTGFGLADSILDRCDFLLEPIGGAAPDNYRHLSVRSAVSICLDRLLGTW